MSVGAKDGDAESLNWVIDRLSPVLLAQAAWRLGPRLRRHYDPEDLVSDAWARALPKLGELPSRDGRSTPVLLRFLSTAIVNRVNNLVKKHLRRGMVSGSSGSGSGSGPVEGLSGLAAEMTGAVTAIARREHVKLVEDALGELEPKDREIVFLRGIEQRALSTVSELLGVTPEAAAMRFLRALKRLRARLPGSVFEELEES